MGPIQTLGEFLAMLRRRAMLLVAVTVAGCLAAVLYALNQPHVYEAAATIQVESPLISESPGADGGPLVRRIQVIEQELMARDNVLDLVERFELFAGQPLNDSEKVVRFRQITWFERIAAPGARPGEGTSVAALVIHTRQETARKAVTVANAMAEQVIEQGEQRRTRRSREALRFFEEEEARLSDEIATLEDEIAAFKNTNEDVLPGSLAARRAELARLRESALEVERTLIGLRRERADLEDDPARAVMQRRVATLESEIAGQREQRELLQARISELESQISRAPEVERQLGAYERRLNQLQERYAVITRRRAEAEIGQRLETGGQGERFEILERAVMPEYPSGPSRRRIAGAGGVASLGTALVLAFLLELLNPVVRTSAQMQRELDLRPVITIPYVETPAELRRRHLRRLGVLVVLTLAALVMAGLALAG